jgi:hypothetical protein
MPAVVRRSYSVLQRDFQAEIDRLASFAWRAYHFDLTPLYLVGRKATGLDTLNPRAEIWTELSCEHEAADGWECVRSEHIPRDETLEQVRGRIRDWLSREPLWIFAD